MSKIYEDSKKELRTKYGTSLKEKLKLKIQKSNDLKKRQVTLRKQLEKNFIEKSVNPPLNFPEELKPFWMQKEWGLISKKLNAKKQVIKEHEKFLTRGLGRKGKSLEWFIETFKDEIKN